MKKSDNYFQFRIARESFIISLDISPDGNYLAVLMNNHELIVLPAGNCAEFLHFYPSKAGDWWRPKAIFSPDGTALLTGNNKVQLYSFPSLKSTVEFKLTKRSELRGFAFCPDKKHIASLSLAISSGRDNALKLWDVESGKWKKSVNLAAPDGEMILTPAGELAVLTEYPSELLFFNSTDLKKRIHVKLPEQSKIWGYENLKATEEFVYLNRAFRLNCFDSKTGKLLWEHEFPEPSQKLSTFFNAYNYGKFDISNDGRYMIRIGFPDPQKKKREIILFDLSKKQIINTYQFEENELDYDVTDRKYGQILFAPDNKSVWVALGNMLQKIDLEL